MSMKTRPQTAVSTCCGVSHLFEYEEEDEDEKDKQP